MYIAGLTFEVSSRTAKTTLSDNVVIAEDDGSGILSSRGFSDGVTIFRRVHSVFKEREATVHVERRDRWQSPALYLALRNNADSDGERAVARNEESTLSVRAGRVGRLHAVRAFQQ
jgi:hypothetical protein